MGQLSRRVSYFVSSLLYTYFSCFIQDFLSFPSSFAFKTLISPRSFYHQTFGIFQFFSSFYKPVNRSIHTCLCSHVAERFCVKRVYLSRYSQKTRKEFEKFGLSNTKKIWLETILAYAHLWRGSTEIESSSQKMAQQVWKYIVNEFKRHNFCLNDLLTKSNHTEMQTYKVEERTFGTTRKKLKKYLKSIMFFFLVTTFDFRPITFWLHSVVTPYFI